MKKTITALLALFLLSVLAVACSTSSQATSAAENTSTNSAQQNAPASTSVEESQQAEAYSSGTLTLSLVSPQDGSETNLPQTELKGTVSENAVLSINDEIYMLDAGNFSQQIPLEAGPNVLQIVVSDDSGNEIDLVLTITYTAD